MSRKTFHILLKKNLIVELRSYLQTFIEVVTVFVIFYICQQLRSNETGQETHIHRNLKLDDLSQFKKLMYVSESTIPYKIYFTPNNNYTRNILMLTAKKLNLIESVGFDNEDVMIKQFNASTTLAAVILDGHSVTLRFPNYFRTRPNKNFHKLQDFWLTRCGHVVADDKKNYVDYYIREGFLPLLYTIVRTQMDVENGELLEMPRAISSVFRSMDPKTISINKCDRKKITPETFTTWILLYFMYFVPFINLIWKFSREHEENVFAHQRTYGISYNIQIFAHFIVSLLHFVILDSLAYILIFFLWPAMPFWKSSLLFAFLITQSMLLIVYAMILSSVVKNAATGVWCGLTLWITSFAMFSELLNSMNFDVLNYKILIISIIFFNNLFANGLVEYFDGKESKSLNEITILLGVQLMLLLFYACLLKYKDHNWPCRRGSINKPICKLDCKEFKPKLNENYIEYGPINGGELLLKNVYSYCNPLNKGSQIRNISMRFFINEISVILGTKNSGKTNFISTLAGWLPYEGHIHYKGHDIAADISYYRQHVDVSMSNNSLFDCLTITETLRYFILLKHTEGTQLKSELEKWLNIMRPVANCKKLAKKLTFGEKRILALCCAMVCNTTVVLLDEPTTLMSTEDQNRYWNILMQEKRGRLIIVTTLSVEEANEIGDRIGILNIGCLIAWGTSYFLRNKFDADFYLVCFLQSKKPIKPITQLLEEYIQNPRIQNHFKNRIIYIIPAEKKSVFQQLLIQLEKDSSTLGITNIYITGSSLNEVYMNALKSKPGVKLPDIKTTLELLKENKYDYKSKKALVQAICYKKLLWQSKNILPICMIFISFFAILAFRQMSPASVNVDGITFSGETLTKDKEPSLITISKVDGIKNGLFYYNKLEYLNESYENISSKSYDSWAGLEVNKSAMTVWFNENIFHSAPLALHLAFNYFTNASTYINKPIILRSNYYIHIILGTINPLTSSIAFVNIQEERFSNMLTLQKLPCLNEKIKWSVTFLWDFSISLLISILYLIFLLACIIAKSNWLIVLAAVILFFLSSMTTLIFIYLMSLFINEDNKIRAISKIFFIQLMLGLLPYILYTNILQKFDILFYTFMFLPGFSVLHGTNKIFDNTENVNLASYFEWEYPGILDSIFFISLMFLIYLTIFVAVNVYRRAYFKSTPTKVKTFASVCYPHDDERVVKERVRISNMSIVSCKNQAVLVDQLERNLPKKGKRINSISFALNKQTCLGIYGTNQSGKSYLLKQLIGENPYWFGEVYIAGFNCKREMASALKNIGYCPQNMGFNSLLAPTELLTYFLILYGVNKSKHLDLIREVCVILQLRKYMNCRMADLPENIKRRINVAVALIGRNKIIIFDEPTKGLAPFDRLLIWNIIKCWRNTDKTIIFTTSESLELKELADVMLMVNDGEMLAYDNPHNMEYQHNIGFYLDIKLYSDGSTLQEVEENLSIDIENLNRFIRFFHEDSELQYRCDNVVQYYIPVQNVIYSYIFGSMEKNRNRLNIADYTLAPFSLNRILKSLQKARKEKRHDDRSHAKVLKDPKTLPRRYQVSFR